MADSQRNWTQRNHRHVRQPVVASLAVALVSLVLGGCVAAGPSNGALPSSSATVSPRRARRGRSASRVGLARAERIGWPVHGDRTLSLLDQLGAGVQQRTCGALASWLGDPSADPAGGLDSGSYPGPSPDSGSYPVPAPTPAGTPVARTAPTPTPSPANAGCIARHRDAGGRRNRPAPRGRAAIPP